MKFIVSLIAVLGTTEALKLREGETSMGTIIETSAVNDDFSLVADTDDQEDGCFLSWAAKFGMSYTTDEELTERKKNWAENNRAIRAANREALESGEKNPAMQLQCTSHAVKLSQCHSTGSRNNIVVV